MAAGENAAGKEMTVQSQIHVSPEQAANANFRRYIDMYCKTRNVSVDEALQHQIVKNVGKYYAEEDTEQKTGEIFHKE